jgi:hypothetical protein
MSYYLAVGGEDWTQIASLSGWAKFREWAEGQSGDELRHLIDHGWGQDIPTLEVELKKALDANPPTSDVGDIALAVLKALGNRQPDYESVLLTDGLTSEDDPDDSGWESEN